MLFHKKYKRHLLCALTFTLIFLSGCEFSQNNNTQVSLQSTSSVIENRELALTPAQINEDFESMMTLIEENYPFLEINKRVNGVDFMANKEKYRETLKDIKTAEELHMALNAILADLNNGHTGILGHKGITPDYARSVYKAIEEEGYSAWVETLSKKEVFTHYGGDTAGKQIDTQNKSEHIFPNTVQSYLLLDGKIAYLRVDSFNYFNIEADKKQVTTFLNEAKNSEALIIDIRKNGGGSTRYWSKLLVEPLLKESITDTTYTLYKMGAQNQYFLESLAKSGNFITQITSKLNGAQLKPISELKTVNLPAAKPEVYTTFDSFKKSEEVYKPKNTVGFNGKIYLLVSENVYSSAEGFAAFSKNTKFATLIGTRTGGDGIGSDPGLYCLPNSGLVVRYSRDYGIYANGAANEEVKTEPDYLVNNNDMPSNLMKDECIQKVLSLEGLMF